MIHGGSKEQGVDDSSDFMVRGKMNAVCVLQISVLCSSFRTSSV